eukprot:110700_1
MFLLIVICVQYLLFISNSTQSECNQFMLQFMDIIIMKFWRETDCIHVDEHPSESGVMKTNYSWKVTGRRPSSKSQDYLDRINVTNTDLINSWYSRYSKYSKVNTNYFVDLYYENRKWKRLHWIIVTQRSNFKDEWYVKAQSYCRAAANLHSVNMNHAQ